MNIIGTIIPEVKLVEPRRLVDERGYFSEVYSRRVWAASGIRHHFVQDNHSFSARRGVVRGLHFQIPPFAQTKLVRVLRGSIFDAAVDLRRGSPTFGRFVAAVLSATNWKQILIPKGFAHGFCTLEPNTEVMYKVDNYYSREHDRGLLWSDAEIGIDWPIAAEEILLAPRDRTHPRLAQLPDCFSYISETVDTEQPEEAWAVSPTPARARERSGTAVAPERSS